MLQAKTNDLKKFASPIRLTAEANYQSRYLMTAMIITFDIYIRYTHSFRYPIATTPLWHTDRKNNKTEETETIFKKEYEKGVEKKAKERKKVVRVDRTPKSTSSSSLQSSCHFLWAGKENREGARRS